MTLTVIQVKNFKASSKTYRKYDGNGLYVEVTPKGQKYWRYKYHFAGKEKRISLGVFPTVSLKEARLARDKARLKLSNDVDPSAVRKAKQEYDVAMNEHSFAAIALEWHTKLLTNKAPSHAKRVWRGIEKNFLPVMGDKPISMITASHIRTALELIEQRGALETARRSLQYCSRIFRYAIAKGYCEKDPTIGLKDSLAPPVVTHFPSIIEPKKIGELLREIDAYDSPITRYAMYTGVYTFVQPANIRMAEWSEFNIEKKEWKIPAEKMKLRRAHIVPLATQMITLLKELKMLTSNSIYLFPSIRSRSRPMSENTINAAFRRMGYTKDEMTCHGFRHMASTLLNEEGKWNPDAIERQLAHVDKNKIRAVYDRSSHLAERKRMMQAWADTLDNLAHPNNVVHLPASETG